MNNGYYMNTVNACPLVLLALLSLFINSTYAVKYVQDSYRLYEAAATDKIIPNKGGGNTTTTIGDLDLDFSHGDKAFGDLEGNKYIYIYIYIYIYN